MRVILVALGATVGYVLVVYAFWAGVDLLLGTAWPGLPLAAALIGLAVGVDARRQRLPGAGNWALAAALLIPVGLPMYAVMRTTPGGYAAWEGWLRRAVAASHER